MNELINECLSFLNIPIRQGEYKGKEFPYITYFEVLCLDTEFSDDKAEREEHRIQIDFWIREDPTEYKKKIRKALKSKFYNITSNDIKDGDIWHIVFDMYHYEEEEEE